jgi:hypothetical protein
MNQARNLIQYKNLTDEESVDFDFENYKYEMQYPNELLEYQEATLDILPHRVYRLIIEDDKWYWLSSPLDVGLRQGETLDQSTIESATVLRPARKDEIPQQEKTPEEKIKEKWPDKEAVMFDYDIEGVLREQGNLLDGRDAHLVSQSKRGFSGYVYCHEENNWLVSSKPVKSWRNKFVHPKAALFEVGK